MYNMENIWRLTTLFKLKAGETHKDAVLLIYGTDLPEFTVHKVSQGVSRKTASRETAEVGQLKRTGSRKSAIKTFFLLSFAKRFLTTMNNNFNIKF